MKDQKLILTKFGAVCKQNNCVIASKNAVRVMELLLPDNARIFRLFTKAILSSIHLQAVGDKKTIRVSHDIWLVQSNELVPEEWSPATRTCARWKLEKMDLQVIATGQPLETGQLLLSVRSALWPSLLAVTDLIDPDVWPLDQSRPTTLFLTPTGQLARYRGVWITATHFKREANHDLSDEELDIIRTQHRWIEKVTAMLETRIPLRINSGTIWLEAEIPVLREEEHDTQSRILEWKKIYWPAALSYVFEQSAERNSIKEFNERDPFISAAQWFSSGAAAAQSSKPDDYTTFNPAFDSDEHRLFDDDVQFDSPQNFMSIPMQAFAQSQLIYPTPPDGLNTQPTPGMSVDGMVQTPATINQIMGSNMNSSPLNAIAHELQAPATAQAVSNFLNHDVDNTDDLFDDMEDDKLRHGSFDHEPNWDFFNSEGLPTDEKNKSTDHVTDDMESLLNEKKNIQSPEDIRSYSPEASPKHLTKESLAQAYENEEYEKEVSETTTNPQSVAEQDAMQKVATSSSLTENEEQQSQPTTDASTTKRRRSSAYEIVLPPETQRDLRYSKDGKYWFEPKKPHLNRSKQLPPVPLYRPSSSSSNTSESSSESMDDEIQQNSSKLHPWVEYTPTAPSQEPERARNEDIDVVETDKDIDALIKLIASATGREPFTTVMPVSTSRKSIDSQDLEDSSLSLQTLAEQIASSSLLSSQANLTLPRNSHASATDVSIDSAGSSFPLPNMSLGNLSLLPPQGKTTRLHSLPHGKICLNQADSKIAADLSILNFWEILNLQPLNGPKKSQTLCIYPKSEAFARGARLFLERMSETWVSCNLGEQQPAVLEDITTDGSVAWDIDTDLAQLCQDVGTAIGKANSELCTVLFLVIPRDDLRECVQLCHGFQELFQAMGEHRTFDSGDIVLQLVLSSLLMDADTIAVPPEDQLITLALEVYQRLPPAVLHEDSFLAPAMTLSEPLTCGPFFELSSNNASPLARHGKSCHVAYCVSLDNRWLVASWSDSLGEMASSVVYRLLDEEGVMAHSRADIFQHMCQISAVMMNRHKQKWWLIIAKVGFFEVEELQDWSVATTKLSKDQKLLSRIALVNIELQPRLALRNTSIVKLTPHIPQTQNVLSTPVTTPQAANTTSPEQATPMTPTAAPPTGFNAPTPPEYNPELSNEADVYVTDAMEDCWVIMLPFGLNQSYEYLEVRPAIASGFLAKRASGQQISDPMLSLLGVNLIFVPRKATAAAALTSAEREQILEEIITQYCGLHLLALAKRIVDTRDSPVPCHIASAYRTAIFLQQFA